jgi:hypothetical protein
MGALHAAADGRTGLDFLAYALGFAARERGETAIGNPFGDSPEAARSWQDGWSAATPARPAAVFAAFA